MMKGEAKGADNQLQQMQDSQQPPQSQPPQNSRKVPQLDIQMVPAKRPAPVRRASDMISGMKIGELPLAKQDVTRNRRMSSMSAPSDSPIMPFEEVVASKLIPDEQLKDGESAPSKRPTLSIGPAAPNERLDAGAETSPDERPKRAASEKAEMVVAKQFEGKDDVKGEEWRLCQIIAGIGDFRKEVRADAEEGLQRLLDATRVLWSQEQFLRPDGNKGQTELCYAAPLVWAMKHAIPPSAQQGQMSKNAAAPVAHDFGASTPATPPGYIAHQKTDSRIPSIRLDWLQNFCNSVTYRFDECRKDASLRQFMRQWLTQRGCDGRTALMVAIERERMCRGLMQLFFVHAKWLIKNKHFDIARDILLQKDNDGQTALMIALNTYNQSIIKCFLVGCGILLENSKPEATSDLDGEFDKLLISSHQTLCSGLRLDYDGVQIFSEMLSVPYEFEQIDGKKAISTPVIRAMRGCGRGGGEGAGAVFLDGCRRLIGGDGVIDLLVGNGARMKEGGLASDTVDAKQLGQPGACCAETVQSTRDVCALVPIFHLHKCWPDGVGYLANFLRACIDNEPARLAKLLCCRDRDGVTPLFYLLTIAEKGDSYERQNAQACLQAIFNVIKKNKEIFAGLLAQIVNRDQREIKTLDMLIMASFLDLTDIMATILHSSCEFARFQDYAGSKEDQLCAVMCRRFLLLDRNKGRHPLHHQLQAMLNLVEVGCSELASCLLTKHIKGFHDLEAMFSVQVTKDGLSPLTAAIVCGIQSNDEGKEWLANEQYSIADRILSALSQEFDNNLFDGCQLVKDKIIKLFNGQLALLRRWADPKLTEAVKKHLRDWVSKLRLKRYPRACLMLNFVRRDYDKKASYLLKHYATKLDDLKEMIGAQVSREGYGPLISAVMLGNQIEYTDVHHKIADKMMCALLRKQQECGDGRTFADELAMLLVGHWVLFDKKWRNARNEQARQKAAHDIEGVQKYFTDWSARQKVPLEGQFATWLTWRPEEQRIQELMGGILTAPLAAREAERAVEPHDDSVVQSAPKYAINSASKAASNAIPEPAIESAVEPAVERVAEPTVKCEDGLLAAGQPMKQEVEKAAECIVKQEDQSMDEASATPVTDALAQADMWLPSSLAAEQVVEQIANFTVRRVAEPAITQPAELSSESLSGLSIRWSNEQPDQQIDEANERQFAREVVNLASLQQSADHLDAQTQPADVRDERSMHCEIERVEDQFGNQPAGDQLVYEQHADNQLIAERQVDYTDIQIIERTHELSSEADKFGAEVVGACKTESVDARDAENCASCTNSDVSDLAGSVINEQLEVRSARSDGCGAPNLRDDEVALDARGALSGANDQDVCDDRGIYNIHEDGLDAQDNRGDKKVSEAQGAPEVHANGGVQNGQDGQNNLDSVRPSEVERCGHASQVAKDSSLEPQDAAPSHAWPQEAECDNWRKEWASESDDSQYSEDEWELSEEADVFGGDVFGGETFLENRQDAFDLPEGLEWEEYEGDEIEVEESCEEYEEWSERVEEEEAIDVENSYEDGFETDDDEFAQDDQEERTCNVM